MSSEFGKTSGGLEDAGEDIRGTISWPLQSPPPSPMNQFIFRVSHFLEST